MGDLWAHDLPRFLAKWNVPTLLVPGWESRARGSGGFNTMSGVSIHHTASSVRAALGTSLTYANEVSPNAPIANGLISRTKDGPVFAMCAAGATNTSGRGGPRMSSRGPISRDTANSNTFGIEAENNGRGEPWADEVCDLYVLACAAVLEWATESTPGGRLGPGDVFAHHEWAPGRKIDPAGPCRFAPAGGSWDMDAFRGEVFMAIVNHTPPPPDPILPPGPEVGHGECPMPFTSRTGQTGMHVVDLQQRLAARGWYSYALDGQYGARTQQGVQKLQIFLRNNDLVPGPIDGQYGDQTRAAWCVAEGF